MTTKEEVINAEKSLDICIISEKKDGFFIEMRFRLIDYNYVIFCCQKGLSFSYVCVSLDDAVEKYNELLK